MPRRASSIKKVGMAEVEAPVSLDGWHWQCIWIVGAYDCYLHFAPENPEDGKQKYGNPKKEKLTEAWKEYKKNRQSAKRVISLANRKIQKECASDSNDPNLTIKQMVKEIQDITSSN